MVKVRSIDFYRFDYYTLETRDIIIFSEFEYDRIKNLFENIEYLRRLSDVDIIYFYNNENPWIKINENDIELKIKATTFIYDEKEHFENIIQNNIISLNGRKCLLLLCSVGELSFFKTRKNGLWMNDDIVISIFEKEKIEKFLKEN